MRTTTLLASAGPLVAAFALSMPSQFDLSSYKPQDVIVVDVAVVGGGATGTFSAVNLQKQGKSVVIVEKTHLLGGPTHTYTDPQSNVSIDWGVQTYWKTNVTEDYFAELDLTVGGYDYPIDSLFADFNTGETVKGAQQVFDYHDYDPYVAQLAKYPTLAYSWNLTYPIAPDLLLPFKDFVNKYNLSDIAFSIFEGGRGAGNLLESLTVNVFKLIDGSFINALKNASINPKPDNRQIYDSAGKKLAGRVLFNSTVTAAVRSKGDAGVLLVVKTPNGNKLVVAKKLLVTIPLLIDNSESEAAGDGKPIQEIVPQLTYSAVKPFDLDANEASIFSKFRGTYYYQMLIKNSGLPSNCRATNAIASTERFHIPQVPGGYVVTYTRIPDVFNCFFGSPYPVAEADVKTNVTNAILNLRKNVKSNVTSPPEIFEFADSSPWKLVVDADSLKKGFYNDLWALQGQRNTFYTGAAMMSEDASVLWNYTLNVVLPQVLA